MRHLLAVDLGLWTGLALFRDGAEPTQTVTEPPPPEGLAPRPPSFAPEPTVVDGPRLVWFRSHHFPDLTRLRRAVWDILRECAPLDHLIAEGDPHYGRIWTLAARKQGARTRVVNAERWRERLLSPRQRRHGDVAKRTAIELAGEVVSWSGLSPRRLRHDTAEAVLLGIWGMLEVGWIERPPW